MKSIGLCMIVKNEARVITRCLESVRSLIDHVLIEDTGSADGTQEVIRGWLARHGIAGEVIEEPWRDFAFNRTHVLEALRKVGSVDYALIIDADDTLEIDASFDVRAFKAQMIHDLYDVPVRHGSIAHHRPQLFSNRLPFSFKGVVHEYLEAPPGPLSRDTAKGFAIRATTGGARSANPRKYQDDAAVLERALVTETDPFLISRYTFYLAQSYRDCGENEKALANYLKRAEQGYWAEEIFCSLCHAGRIKQALGHPPDDVIATFLRASDVAPARGEALHAAARFCRLLGRNEEGFQYAKRGVEKPLPAAGLFIESWIYDYGLLDEIGINGYWSGHFREALDACLKLLASKALPDGQRERIMKNAQSSLAKLPGDPNPARFRPKGLSPGQHALQPPRDLRSALPEKPPKILLAILAKQKEISLPLYLRCIEALDYPKSSIVVYIRTNNNKDRTGAILAEWVERVRGEYAAIEMDASDVAQRVQDSDVHEWNATRFSVLAKIRTDSLLKTLEYGCDFYFTADVDNFIRPCALRELAALNLPIVAPLLRSVDPRALYLNCHVDIDANGYYRGCDEYYAIFNQSVVGVFELPVVHCTYLIRASCIPALAYADGTPRHEYVIFSDVARKAGIPQYYDNRQIYGYLTLKEEADAAMKLIGPEIGAKLSAKRATTRPNLFACFIMHSSGSTWVFNLAREICRSQGIDFVSLHRDFESNLPWSVFGTRLIIARTPNPSVSFQAFMSDCNEPAVITVRDPRDALVSFMQRFPNSLATNFDQALKAIALSAGSLVSMARQRKLPIFRYEDGFVGSAETFDRIAALLGVTPSEAERRAILAGLSAESVKRKIGELEAAGAIRGESVWDTETHWHFNHVGDGKVGKFRDFLTEAQLRKVEDETREYCELFGYEARASLPSKPTKARSEATSPDRIPELQLSKLMEWRKSREAQSSAEAARFVDFCLTYPGKTKAQNFQDFFVLHQLGSKRGGFFVEFGAGDGDYLSNSIMLEQEFSWNGILAESARCNTEKLRRTRTCAIDERCVWRSSGQRLTFVEAKEPELSTISDFIHCDMNAPHRLSGKRYEVVSVSLNELLSDHNVPRRIDYLSIDTEGSEYEILQAFDFEKYDVRVLTVEHNYSSKRDDLFKLLSSKGFERKFRFFSNVDDWYVRNGGGQ